MPDLRTTAISADCLSKKYGRRSALGGCNFDLPVGSSLVVFGPNGAGKSTLLRLLCMLESPTSGNFNIFGCDPKKDPDAIRSSVGLVSHSPMLYPDLTAEENLIFYARMYGMENPGERARDLLDFVELSSRRDDAVRGFSRGMTQRICIARALVNDPSLILLDEPYSGLDPHASRIVDSLFSNLQAGFTDEKSRTIVSVSHSIDRGYHQASHVLLLSRGRQELFSKASDLDYDSFRERIVELSGEGASR